jgi:hypothetical protein
MEMIKSIITSMYVLCVNNKPIYRTLSFDKQECIDWYGYLYHNTWKNGQQLGFKCASFKVNCVVPHHTHYKRFYHNYSLN